MNVALPLAMFIEALISEAIAKLSSIIGQYAGKLH